MTKRSAQCLPTPLLPLVLLLLPASVACSRTLRAVRCEETIGRITVVRDEPKPPSLVEVPLKSLPAHVENLYRLAPDRRLLIATCEVRRVLSGKSACEVSYGFHDGKWAIRVGATEAGRLPEIPTWSDAQAFLAGWAARELREAGRPKIAPLPDEKLLGLATTLGGAEPEEVLRALEELNRFWKKGARDPRLTREAVRGLTWLSAQTYDRLELADPLLGRAWAFLAIARAQSRTPDQRGLAADEALLADTLGYEAGGRAAAEALGADDPVRLYVNHSTARLKVAAEASQERRAKLLFLLRFAESGKSADWYAWLSGSRLGTERSLGILTAALALDDFGPNLEQLAMTRSLVGSAVLPAGDAGRTQPAEGQLAKLDRAIVARGEAASGGVLNAESVEGFYRASLYSSIHGTIRYFLSQLATKEGTGEYLKSLVAPPPGVAAELAKWGADRLAMWNDLRQAKLLVEDISAFGSLRAEPMAEIRQRLTARLSTADPQRRSPMPAFFEKLDTRPAGLLRAYQASVDNLFDPVRSEVLIETLAREAPFLAGSLEPVPVFRRRDRERLWQIARAEDRSPEARGWAFRDLVRMDKRLLPAVRQEYERLMCEETENSLAGTWVGLCSQERDLQSALATVRRWVDCRTEKNDLSRAWAAAAEANLLRRMGKAEEAWRVIEPWVETWKGDVMNEAVEDLTELGRFEEALAIARAAQDRYGSDGVEVAGVLWRAGRPDEAADVLKANERRISDYGWARARMLFGTAYAGRTTDAIRAFDLIKSRKIVAQGAFTPLLSWIALGLSEAGDHETSFELHSRVDVGIPSDIEYARLSAYEELRRARGDEAATKWLAANVPATSNQMAIILLQERKFDLLLNVTAAAANATKNDVIQLFRAAALRHLKRADGPEMKELVAYFEGRPRTESFVRNGLFLTGARDENVFPEMAPDIETICSIGWIRGVRAASEGRFKEAGLWLQAALEAKRNALPPDAYARDILSRWWSADETIAAQEAERAF